MYQITKLRIEFEAKFFSLFDFLTRVPFAGMES